jgi:FAD/FMN-containing dehydrogenase
VTGFVELDETISHYQRISLAITNQLTLDRIKEAVEELEAAKAALHPEQEQ